MCMMGKWIFRDGEEFVDKHGAADILEVDERTVDRYRKKGLLQTYLLRGWHVRLLREEVARLRVPEGPITR